MNALPRKEPDVDYSRRELAERLAAEYVLGTLRGPARRRMQALLPAHPALRNAVDAWQRRLMPMAQSLTPVAPAAPVWRGIEGRLFAERSANASHRADTAAWWQGLALWRGVSGVAMAAVVSMAVLLVQAPETLPPVVVVLATNAAASDVDAGMRNASFVASLSADGRALVLKPIGTLSLQATRALELWAVPAQGAPRSLGLVNVRDGATILRSGLLANTAAFAVSLEPSGGSPTGAPTGPILSVGKLGT